MSENPEPLLVFNYRIIQLVKSILIPCHLTNIDIGAKKFKRQKKLHASYHNTMGNIDLFLE